MRHILSKFKQILKKTKIHWLRRGVFIAPQEYKAEISKIECIKDYYCVSIRYNPVNLSSTIRRYAHLIEKGLYMPNRRADFGKINADILNNLIKQWDTNYSNLENETIEWARNIYRLYLAEAKNINQKKTNLTHCSYNDFDREVFEKILFNRRSCRNFNQSKTITQETFYKLIKYANASPSSCNRQTCLTYIISNKEDLSFCENFSQGGKGFASQASSILIICVDMSSYILPSERNLIFVDGGIYAQSLMLGAEILGLSTCFLNWVFQTREEEKKLQQRFKIPEYYEIIGLICIGYSEFENNPVPRKPLQESMIFVTE